MKGLSVFESALKDSLPLMDYSWISFSVVLDSAYYLGFTKGILSWVACVTSALL